MVAHEVADGTLSSQLVSLPLLLCHSVYAEACPVLICGHSHQPSEHKLAEGYAKERSNCISCTQHKADQPSDVGLHNADQQQAGKRLQPKVHAAWHGGRPSPSACGRSVVPRRVSIPAVPMRSDGTMLLRQPLATHMPAAVVGPAQCSSAEHDNRGRHKCAQTRHLTASGKAS